MPTWVSTSFVDQSGSITPTSQDFSFDYIVLFSTSDAKPYDACTASGVDPLGSVVGSAKCQSISAKVTPNTNNKEWRVTCNFSVPQPGQQEPKPVGVTKNWNVQVAITAQTTEEAITSTKDDLLICNRNGEAINPPLTKTIYDRQITITYQTDAPDLAEMENCEGKLNSNPVTLFINGTTREYAAGTLLCGPSSVNAQYDMNGTAQASATLNLFHRKDGWTRKVPFKSLYVWDSTADCLVPIVDAYGHNVTEPQFLDSTGENPLEDGDTVITDDFDIEEQVDFSTLLSEIAV
jgi:hypothetical protein